MTRLEALKELAEKVEAGEFTPEPGGAVMPHYKRFTALSDIALPQDVRALDVLAHDAYKGSLDSALALHEAVLPGWDWLVRPGWARVESPDFECVTYFAGGAITDDVLAGRVATATIEPPARAWLLAILRALIAQEEQ